MKSQVEGNAITAWVCHQQIMEWLDCLFFLPDFTGQGKKGFQSALDFSAWQTVPKNKLGSNELVRKWGAV